MPPDPVAGLGKASLRLRIGRSGRGSVAATRRPLGSAS